MNDALSSRRPCRAPALLMLLACLAACGGGGGGGGGGNSAPGGTDPAPVQIGTLPASRQLACTQPQYQGWCWFGPRATAFTAVTMANASTGWRVGPRGAIERTLDGGSSWQPQFSPNPEDLMSITVFDTQEVWILDAQARLMVTQDGGSTWRVLPRPWNPAFSPLERIQVWPLGQGRAVAYLDSNFWSTTDGGVTWRPDYEQPSRSRAYFPGTPEHVWSLGDGWTGGIGGGGALHIARRRFDSDIWVPVLDRVQEDVAPGTLSLGDFKTIDATTWMATQVWFRKSAPGVRQSELLITTDAGTHWTTLSLSALLPPSAFDNARCNALHAERQGQQLLVQCAEKVWSSADGGQHWSPATGLPEAGALASSLRVKAGLMTLSAAGRFYVSQDGGGSWTALGATAPTTTASDDTLQILDAQTLAYTGRVGTAAQIGLQRGARWLPLNPSVEDPRAPFGGRAVAFVGGADVWRLWGGGTIERSTDAGAHWQTLPEIAPNVGAGISSRLVRLDAARAFLIGPAARLMQTEDGGAHWSEVKNPETRLAVELRFQDTLRGWLRMGDSVSTGAVTTVDGGRTWQRLPLPNSTTSLLATDSGAWVAVTGSGTILRTENQGATWAEALPAAPAGDFRSFGALAAQDARRLWALSRQGELFRSDDEGRNWTRRASLGRGWYSDMKFNGAQGWILDGDGRLLTSIDGGETWQVQVLPASRLDRLQWIDARTLVIHGNFATLVSTSQGSGIPTP